MDFNANLRNPINYFVYFPKISRYLYRFQITTFVSKFQKKHLFALRLENHERVKRTNVTLFLLRTPIDLGNKGTSTYQ